MKRSARRRFLTGLGAGTAALARSSKAQTLLFNSIRLNRQEFARLWEQQDVRFLAYAFAHRQRSRSQILQDLWVCFELGEKQGGFFVEYGATNGLTNSNTWLLEHELGWKGILAEPNPYWHDELSANRSVPIDHRCVSSSTGGWVDFIATDSTDPELSGIADFSQGDHFSQARSVGTRIEVETVSLDDLLKEYGAPAVIDYMSVDTEGSELDILRAFDFATYRPTLMSVEHSASTEADIERLLRSHDYRRVFAHLSQWDGWYVSRDLHDRSLPPMQTPLA